MVHSTRIPKSVLLSLAFLVFLRVETFAADKSDLSSRVGQLFIFGIAKPELDSTILDHLKKTRPGGYILFRRNMLSNQQTATLINQLQDLSQENHGLSAFIAIDQEGGGVFRLPFYPAMPSPWAVGQAGNPQLAQRLGWQVGKALRQLGFNMNLAPVLDLGSETKPTFLGTRSFSANETTVANIGTAFAHGLQQARVIPVAKHFPGMGSIINDPHQSLVRRSSSLEEMQADLHPFREFSKLLPSGIMLSHLVYPKMDSKNEPATYSSDIVKHLLLGELGYKGLIITDDMMMEGALATHDFKENVVRAFEAGADLIMVSWSRQRQRLALQAILSAVRSGRLSREEVLARIDKIAKIKKTLPPLTPMSFQNDRLLASGIGGYLATTDEIFQENWRKQLILNIGRSHDLFEADQYFLLPSQAKYANLLNEYLPIDRKIKVLNDISSPWPQKLADSGTLLFFVRSKEDVVTARSLPDEVWQKTLVINQLKPHFISKSLPHEIQMFLFNRQLYPRVAQLINGAGGDRSQLAAAQFPTGSSPIRRRPKTRSQDELRKFSGVPDSLSRPLLLEKSRARQEH